MSAIGAAATQAVLETARRSNTESQVAECAERLKMAIAEQDWSYQFADGTAYYKGANQWDRLKALAAQHSELSDDEATLDLLNTCTPSEVLDQQGRFTAENLNNWRLAKRRGAIRA